MDYRLIRRRHRARERGTECWLVAFYEPDGDTPILAVTNAATDITYDGDLYTSYHLSVAEPPGAGEEGLPTGQIKISNVTLGLQASMAASDYYRGGTCVIIPYNTEEPDVDYSTDQVTLQIISHDCTLQTITFTLAVPKELIEQVPEDLYGPFSCRHRFKTARCGYADKTVDDITLTGSDPVSVGVTGHGLVTGDSVELSGVEGISPALDGIYDVTYTDDNTFTLDGTDSSDYSGSYSSGGMAGHSFCPRHRAGCRARERIASFGGTPGLRQDGIVLGV